MTKIKRVLVTLAMSWMLWAAKLPPLLPAGTSAQPSTREKSTGGRAAPNVSHPSVILADDLERGAGAWDLNGDWTVRARDGNHVLHGVAYSFAQAHPTWGDYRFEARVRVQSGEAKLAIRVGDRNAGYYLGLEADGELNMQKWDGAAWTDLGRDPGPYPAGQWHRLALEAQGDQLRGYVESELKIVATDDAYPSGVPMLNAFIGQADFDDVWMTGDAPAACPLVPSNGLNNPFGIAFNTHGELFVTDGGKFSRVTDEQRAVFVARVGAPGDLVIDDRDNAYVVSPDDRSILQVAPGGTQTTLITFPDPPWDLAMGPDGYLYVGVEADVMRVDLSDASSSVWMTGVAGAMAFDDAGNLYSQANEVIRKITPGKAVSVVTVLPTIRPYKQYTGIAVDKAGNLYVAEALGPQWSPTDPPWVPPIVADQVLKIAPDGRVSTFATGLGGVWGLTFGPDGCLYVSEHDLSGISRIAPDGTVTPVVPRNGLASVDAAQYSPDGDLYFVNTEAFNVSWLDAQNEIHVLGTGLNVAGCGGGRPALAFNAAGELYVAEAHSDGPNRITRIAGGTATVFSHDVACPNGLALDRETGEWYVSEGLRNTIVRFSSDGARHAFVSGLRHPLQLAFGPDGLLYVAEWEANRVSRIDGSGTVTRFAAVPHPSGLAFRGDDLFVSSDVETGDIWRIDRSGTAARFAYGPSYVGGITIAPDGAVVAACSGDNSLYRFFEGGTHPGVAVTVPEVALGRAGQVVTHTFTVHNAGNGADGFWLAVESEHGWPLRVQGGEFVGPVACGQTRSVEVAVTIPAGAEMGATDALTLTARSRLDAGRSATAQAATVNGYGLYLPLVVKGHH